MKPSKKSPEMEKFLTDFFGKDRRIYIADDVCVDCGEPAEHFRDELSRKEYTISGLCQICQDNFFGTE
jgi:hypothetical protein